MAIAEEFHAQNALIVQRPPASPQQLILLFHGMGSNPRAMRPLGERLALEFPNALVVAPQAPTPSGNPNGFEWFGVDGITEENRVGRVALAMPAFEACVAHWQREAGVAAPATALVGFSQGAIMSLESATRSPPCAGRIVAIGGRFAALPVDALVDTTVHFLHGKEDAVIPYRNTVLAAHHLRDLGVRHHGRSIAFHRAVAVGTEVSPRPPHRSVRAELPHTAPASGM